MHGATVKMKKKKKKKKKINRLGYKNQKLNYFNAVFYVKIKKNLKKMCGRESDIF
jgi:ABC-type Mn2+/Zn2+ transport system ATPase subunit